MSEPRRARGVSRVAVAGVIVLCVSVRTETAVKHFVINQVGNSIIQKLSSYSQEAGSGFFVNQDHKEKNVSDLINWYK